MNKNIPCCRCFHLVDIFLNIVFLWYFRFKNSPGFGLNIWTKSTLSSRLSLIWIKDKCWSTVFQDNIWQKRGPFGPYASEIVKQAPCKIMSLQRYYGPGCQQSRSIVQCSIYGADIRLKRPEQTETVEQRDQ